ncbi:MAG: hypothetical protein GY858_09890 [Candidatus Omnitrophica bacterium]|nr:hypothetical protein [Candidatus Omnitrophota bacterium]
MFGLDFLNFFKQNAGNLLMTGTTLVSGYAQLEANKARTRATINELNHKKKQLNLNKEYDEGITKESTKDYMAFCSYELDKMKKDQLHDRKTLTYAILLSGITINEDDTAGKQLKARACQDELALKAAEAKTQYGKPKPRINYGAIDLSHDNLSRETKDVKGGQKWMEGATVVNTARQTWDIWKK